MRYRWTEKDLLSARDKLIKILQNEKDYQRQCYYLKVLDAINNLDFMMYSPVQMKTPSINDRIIDAATNQTGYGRIYQFIEKFYGEVTDLGPMHDEVVWQLDKQNYDFPTGAYITHDKTLSMVKSFYESFDKDLLEYFRRVYDNRYRTFKFSRPTEFFNGELKTDGTTLFVDGPQRVFIVVNNDKGATKYLNTVHECGHAISNLYNPESSVSEITDCFSEVEGIFPEILAQTELLNPELNADEVKFIRYQDMMNFYDIANSLILQNIIVVEWMNNGYRTDTNLMRKLKEEYGLTRNAVIKVLNFNILSDGKYVLSYAASLALLSIYRVDREKAMALYKQILGLPANEDNFYKVTSMLDLFANLKSETDLIVSDFKDSVNSRGFKL